MDRVAPILNDSWSDLTLFPESVPHILHQDLAYLWILEKDVNLRPANWRVRVEAWKYLLVMLFAGELRIENERLPPPLSDFAVSHGIDRVHWIIAPSTSKVVGVLSPTVLVRPLPDFEEENLDLWNRQRSIGEMTDDLTGVARGYLATACERLEDGAPTEGFRMRLARVLRREFNLDESMVQAIGVSKGFPILRDYSWSRSPGQGQMTEQVRLAMNYGAADRGTSVPRCDSCRHQLLRKDSDPAIPVSGQAVKIKCSSCNETTLLDLKELFIWVYDAGDELVVWKVDPTLLPTEANTPPAPSVDLDTKEVVFTWGEGLVDGHKSERFLKLSAGHRNLRTVAIADIFFTKLLVPGDLKSFKGLPVRSDWIHALKDVSEVAADITGTQVSFAGLDICGWPFPVDKIFTGISLVLEEDLNLGIFPDPEKVPARWRFFRACVTGASKENYRLVKQGFKKRALRCWETKAGIENYFSLSSESDDSLGATFWITRPKTKTNTSETLSLGVDFGTTHSLVYAHGSNHERTPSAETHGILPTKLHTVTYWVSQDGPRDQTLGGFLPDPTSFDQRADPYLFPSSMWVSDKERKIRWSAEPTLAGARQRTGFKWDDDGVDLQTERRAYLEKLLLCCTAYQLVTKKLARRDQINCQIGVAFPMAFKSAERERFERLLEEEVASTLSDQAGIEVSFSSISEAMACVQAFGTWNRGEHYLVADLGGSTLDLALFVQERKFPKILQLGSIRFAAETFIEGAIDPHSKEQEKDRWDLRDAVTSGTSRQRYANNPRIENVLRLFRAVIFEVLRIMAVSENKRGSKSSIKLILAGNGWLLSSAFDPNVSTMTSWREALRVYQGLVGKLGIDYLKVYTSPEMEAMPSAKHFVVRGALANVGGRSELSNRGNFGQRLPAGRDIEFPELTIPQRETSQETEWPGPLFDSNEGRPSLGAQVKSSSSDTRLRIEWYELVGDGAEDLPYAGVQIRESPSKFNVKSFPELSSSWAAYLATAFDVDTVEDIPRPTEERVRQEVAFAGDPDGYLTKGPLQIIVEGAWKERLKER